MADTPQPQDEELVERVAEAIWDADRHPGSTKWGDLRFELQEISRHEARAALAVARPLIRSAVLTEVRARCAESYDDPRLRAIEVVMHREMWDLLNADPDAVGAPDDLR